MRFELTGRRTEMSKLGKIFSTATALTAGALATAMADACDTPSALLGDLGQFKGDVVTIMGSMQGKDEETCWLWRAVLSKQQALLLNIRGPRFRSLNCC